MAVESQATKVNGLKTVIDTIVSPKEAFESIRIVPTWGWALAIAIVLAAVGSYLMVPALQHGLAGSWPEMMAKSPQAAQMTPAQQQAQLALTQKIYSFSWIFTLFFVPIIVLVEAVIMLLFDKMGGGDGTFSKYFAACANIAVVGGGLGAFVAGVIAIVRGADSYTTIQAIQNTVPTLAWLAPGAPAKLAAFLAVFTPFTLWATFLAYMAMTVVGRVRSMQAWLCALILLVVPALLATLGAK